MTTYGMTDDGFVLKPFEVIKTEIQSTLKTTFGAALNLLDTELVGQYVSIISEREALIWELAQAVYNSQSPSSASGVALDDVVAITGIQRLQATKAEGEVKVYGTLATVIPIGTIFSVDGDSDIRFITIEIGTIGAGTDEIQDITFSAVPDSGDFSLSYNGETTGVMDITTVAADVQTQLNNLPSLSTVTVAGDFAGGFTVTFAGADGSKDHPLIVVASNSLMIGAVDISITITETLPGELPNTTILVEGETAGDITAYAGTLIIIETPVIGLDTVTNPLDCTGGTDIETDAELRLRRLQTLANPGAGTVDSIRSKLLEIDAVEACVVYTNRENVVDGDGRPPHSLEAVVLQGDDQDIWDELWDVSPAGIEFVGTQIGTVIDSQGFEQTVKFNRPSEIDIYLEIDLKKNANYPATGDAAVMQDVLDYTDDNFSIGDDVITTELYGPIHETVGIDDVNLRISTAATILIQDLQFDADLVIGNTVSGNVSGDPITPVPFNTTHNQTMIDLATEIALNIDVASAVVSSARVITVTSLVAMTPAAMGSFDVIGGASQAYARIISTSHNDDNIEITSSQISAWDSSRMVITEI